MILGTRFSCSVYTCTIHISACKLHCVLNTYGLPSSSAKLCKSMTLPFGKEQEQGRYSSSTWVHWDEFWHSTSEINTKLIPAIVNAVVLIVIGMYNAYVHKKGGVQLHHVPRHVHCTTTPITFEGSTIARLD